MTALTGAKLKPFSESVGSHTDNRSIVTGKAWQRGDGESVDARDLFDLFKVAGRWRSGTPPRREIDCLKRAGTPTAEAIRRATRFARRSAIQIEQSLGFEGFQNRSKCGGRTREP